MKAPSLKISAVLLNINIKPKSTYCFMCVYKIIWDVDAGRSQVWGLIWLQREFRTSLSNLDPFSKKMWKEGWVYEEIVGCLHGMHRIGGIFLSSMKKKNINNLGCTNWRVWAKSGPINNINEQSDND